MKKIVSRVLSAVVVCLLFCLIIPISTEAFKLAGTGHTKCYQAVGPYAEIPCIHIGQDDVAWPSLKLKDIRVQSTITAPSFYMLDDAVVILEYDSVYSVHSPLDPSRPIRSQPGYFYTEQILSDLQNFVDASRYDFVLLYSLTELPGWIRSGQQGRECSAKNIGIANNCFSIPPLFPNWPKLRSVPHMNSVDFITTQLSWTQNYGTYIAIHEMAHHWCVFWANSSPGPREWSPGMPIAWLASAHGHWSWVWLGDKMPGIMYSGPLSPQFNAFDLYTLGLMGYGEARNYKYQVFECQDYQCGRPPNPVVHDVTVDDLIYSLSLEGNDYFEGDGHRIPDIDPTMSNLNALIVVVKGMDEVITDQQKQALHILHSTLPLAWEEATWGRSTLSVDPGPPAESFDYYCDDDSDTYIDSSIDGTCTGSGCAPQGCQTTPGDDCNDNDVKEYPGQTWYKDTDNDLYSNGDIAVQCLRPAGYKAASELTATSGDINDNDPNIYPGGPPIRDTGAGTTYYSALQSAYNASITGDTIQSQAVTLTENLNLNLNKTVTLQGGYNAGYTSVTGKTTINGNLTISSGAIIIENFILQ